MSKPQMTYFEKEDVLHIIVTNEKEMKSVELSPNITAELNKDGELIGVEILNASEYIRDSILESSNARLLNLHVA